MKECVWVRPELVAQIDFLEWTDADLLRHSKLVGLRQALMWEALEKPSVRQMIEAML